MPFAIVGGHARRARAASSADSGPAPAGAARCLTLAYPLILAHMSFTVQTFVDRLFLTRYSAEAVAGAVTGLFFTLAVMSLFSGTGEYLTTFIAQYPGRGPPLRIGPALWQGFYSAIGAGVLIAAVSPLVGPVFALAGHDPVVQRNEITFATILLRGAFPVVLMATLATFFAGRGQTRVVLVVNVISTLVDIVLDALWIFGRGGFPRWGVAGAAWSTVVAQALGAAIFVVLILRPSCRRAYATLSGWRFDPALPAPAALRPAQRPAVFAGDPAFAIFTDDHRPHRHRALAASGITVQPEHDRVHADARSGSGGERGGGAVPRGRSARRRGARHLVRLLAEPRLHDRLHGRSTSSRPTPSSSLRRPARIRPCSPRSSGSPSCSCASWPSTPCST